MAFTLPFLASAALVASADEGSTGRQTPAGPSIRPPLGVLRHVDAPTASPVSPRPELVVLVGGYQSCACDETFDDLKPWLAALPNTKVVRFGDDPGFPYDTYGSIDKSAIGLRDYIRSVGPEYSAVHIVTHSMGGVVADRAFANGLSHDDGVATYVSWSAPHSGSDAALAVLTSDLAGGGRDPLLHESLLWLQWESESPAVRDLALTRPVAPPPGVVRLDLREATDTLVTPRDARDPGVESRTLDNAREGHGGILHDPAAFDLTVRTIATRAIPPERRSPEQVRAAEKKSDRVGTFVLVTLGVLTAAAIVFSRRSRPFGTLIARALRDFVPRASRKRTA